MKEVEKLFSEDYSSLLRYCRTIVQSSSDAEDIVQHAFVKLWQKLKHGKFTDVSARAYLYKSVYHAAIDFLRHERVKKRFEQTNLTKNESVANVDKVGNSELQAKIEASISKLPEECGRIFRMNRFENMKYREIAAQLNIAEKTVENQMGKALKMLRIMLKDYLPLLATLICLCNGK